MKLVDPVRGRAPELDPAQIGSAVSSWLSRPRGVQLTLKANAVGVSCVPGPFRILWQDEATARRAAGSRSRVWPPAAHRRTPAAERVSSDDDT